MRYALALIALAAFVPAQAEDIVPAPAADIVGQYVEARTCDVWTGPCFANADYNLTGKHAVMAWKISKGKMDGVDLEGLSVVAVVAAGNTLGLEQSAPAKTLLIVDDKANASQKEALVKFVKQQGGKLLSDVVGVQSETVRLTMCKCDGQTCAEVDATVAHVKTRCIDHEGDKACGNETAFHPPLARGVDAKVAGVVEHVFRGEGLAETWGDYDRRGGYVGSFDSK
jgi:hypothetical protein